jgi:hypothetical protein
MMGLGSFDRSNCPDSLHKTQSIAILLTVEKLNESPKKSFEALRGS